MEAKDKRTLIVFFLAASDNVCFIAFYAIIDFVFHLVYPSTSNGLFFFWQRT